MPSLAKPTSFLLPDVQPYSPSSISYVAFPHGKLLSLVENMPIRILIALEIPVKINHSRAIPIYILFAILLHIPQ